MDPNSYGPFAAIVFMALSLVAAFSVVLSKAVGNVNRWTWLAGSSPPFMITAGVRAVVVALMAITLITINSSNYVWFGFGGLVFGCLTLFVIAWFERLRKRYVMEIPVIDQSGSQLLDKKGNPIFESVVVGLESQMLSKAKADFQKARRTEGGLSLREFMAGYGARKLYDPESLWDRALLADLSYHLSLTLMGIILFATMALYLSSLALHVHSYSA